MPIAHCRLKRNHVARFRRGFSFTEVLFAVVVLGIGFIMVAAVFPVAIQQTQVTSEETNGAAIARGAVNYMQTVATVPPPAGAVPPTMMPPTGTATRPDRPLVFSIRNPQSNTPPIELPTDAANVDRLWNALRGNLILPDDDRFGSVLLYRRAGDNATGVGAAFAQVYVIPVQVRSRSRYERAVDVHSAAAPAVYNLQARPVNVTIANGDPLPDRIAFNGGEVDAVVEGAYVIISDDNLAAEDEGRMNGQIYRVGNRVDGTAFWELMPGNDFRIEPDPDGAGPQTAINNLTGADAFIVGRDNATGTYEGPAQDISVYTTFIEVR